MIEAQRILGKVVGHEISVEELEMIAGGEGCSKDKPYRTTNGNDKTDTCDAEPSR